MIRLAIMYWALKRSELRKRQKSTETLTNLNGKIFLNLIKELNICKASRQMVVFYHGLVRSFILIRFATAHDKIVFLISVINPPHFAEYCELSFTVNVYFSMPGCVEPQWRPPFDGHTLCAVFVVAIRCLS